MRLQVTTVTAGFSYIYAGEEHIPEKYGYLFRPYREIQKYL